MPTCQALNCNSLTFKEGWCFECFRKVRNGEQIALKPGANPAAATSPKPTFSKSPLVSPSPPPVPAQNQALSPNASRRPPPPIPNFALSAANSADTPPSVPPPLPPSALASLANDHKTPNRPQPPLPQPLSPVPAPSPPRSPVPPPLPRTYTSDSPIPLSQQVSPHRSQSPTQSPRSNAGHYSKKSVISVAPSVGTTNDSDDDDDDESDAQSEAPSTFSAGEAPNRLFPPPRERGKGSIDFQAFADRSKLLKEANGSTDSKCRFATCWKKGNLQGYCLHHYYEQLQGKDTASAPSSSSSAGPTRPTTKTADSKHPGLTRSPSSEETASPAPSSIDDPEARVVGRVKATEEFVSTEKTYLKALKGVLKSFLSRLKAQAAIGAPILDDEQIAKAFQNIEDIAELHRKLYADLKTLAAQQQLLTPAFAQTLLRYFPFLRMYSNYVMGYDDATKYLRTLREKSKVTQQFFEVGEKVEGMLIDSLLIMPVQRLPRYVLLLSAVLKDTDPKDPNYESISKALEQVKKVTEGINAGFRTRDSRIRVVEIQNNIEPKIDLVSPTRFHVRDGCLRKKYNKWHITNDKSYWFFLFNDLLLYTSMPSAMSGVVKFKHSIKLITMVVNDIPDNPAEKTINAFEIRGEIGKEKSFIVYAESPTEKYDWLTQLNTFIQDCQQRASTLRLGSDLIANTQVPA